MKQIIAILLFACGLATAQVNPPTIWRSSRTAPSGNCPAGTGVETIPGGVLYTCQNGTWTQISGGGGASLAPFTTDGTNVTLPSGTLTVSGGAISATAGYVQSNLGLRGYNSGVTLQFNADNTGVFTNSTSTGHLQLWFQPIGTIASGFGTSPSVTGTDGGGSVTVGSGGTATTGVINFAHTWTSVPQCVANDNTTLLFVQAKATVTTLTLTAATAFGAGDVVVWHCQRSY